MLPRVVLSKCPFHQGFMQNPGKAEHFLRRGERQRRVGGLSVPLRGFIPVLRLQGLGCLIHKVATLAKQSLGDLGG